VTKILSQAGKSLSDMYQVEGSIVGIETLETRDLPIVHEMGATVFSERFRTAILRTESAALNQNVTVSLGIAGEPDSITRILGVQCFADDGARIANAVVCVQNPEAGIEQDFPIWAFDAGNVRAVRIQDNGAVVALDLLVPEAAVGVLPSFITGISTSQGGTNTVRNLTIRAATTGFGAGTVVLFVLVYVGFTDSGGVSAFGAQVPSW